MTLRKEQAASSPHRSKGSTESDKHHQNTRYSSSDAGRVLYRAFRSYLRLGHGLGQAVLLAAWSELLDARKVPDKRLSASSGTLRGASNVTRTHDLLITKSRKAAKITISRRFQHFLLGNQCSLYRLSPLFPSACFAVWVSVCVKTENQAQKLRRSNQRMRDQSKCISNCDSSCGNSSPNTGASNVFIDFQTFSALSAQKSMLFAHLVSAAPIRSFRRVGQRVGQA